MWNLHPCERLRYWQSFRNDLDQKSKSDAINDTHHLWSYAPYVAHYLTTDNIKVWPNPWELLYENYYCNLAKALGIVYTLYLTKHRSDMEIRIYLDPASMEQYNLVFIDQGKYVLNYIHDEVVNSTQIDRSLQLKKVIPSTELGLDKF
jgi:hypothetical protein